jgi:hypothetical protein
MTARSPRMPCFRFDSPRLDPTVVRTIFENELPDNKKPSGAAS